MPPVTCMCPPNDNIYLLTSHPLPHPHPLPASPHPLVLWQQAGDFLGSCGLPVNIPDLFFSHINFHSACDGGTGLFVCLHLGQDGDRDNSCLLEMPLPPPSFPQTFRGLDMNLQTHTLAWPVCKHVCGCVACIFFAFAAFTTSTCLAFPTLFSHFPHPFPSYPHFSLQGRGLFRVCIIVLSG